MPGSAGRLAAGIGAAATTGIRTVWELESLDQLLGQSTYFSVTVIDITGHVFLALAESILYYVYYVLSRNGKTKGDIESIEEVRNVIKQEDLSLDIDIEELRSRLTKPIRMFINDSSEFFDFCLMNKQLANSLRIVIKQIAMGVRGNMKADK